MPRSDSHTDRFQTPAVGRGRGPGPGRPRRRRPGIRPIAESLEDRQLLATVLLDNGLEPTDVGYFAYEVDDGGRGIQSSAFVNGKTGEQTIEDALSAHINFVSVGTPVGGGAVDLRDTFVTVPTFRTFGGGPFGGGAAESRGQFQGVNGTIAWTVTTQLSQGSRQLTNTVRFDSIDFIPGSILTREPFGPVDFINYVDPNIFAASEDIVFASGNPGASNFQAVTLDNAERVGLAHGGVFSTSSFSLLNATWLGWAVGEATQLEGALRGAGAAFVQDLDISTTGLPTTDDVSFGPVVGPTDVSTAFSWRLNPTASSAIITTYLTLNSDASAFNARPVARNDGAVTENGVAVTVPVLANDTDPDGTLDPSTFILTSNPANGTVVINDDFTITYTPTQNFFGSDSFTYTIADDQGRVSNRASVSITIPLPPLQGPLPPPPPPPAPVDPTPVDPTPVDPSPVDPTPADLTGPRVRGVFRFGGRNRTALLVTFSEDMNPALASNFANYVIVAAGRRGARVIPIDSADYNPTTRSVRLIPNRRLNQSRRFQLTIRASSSTGVADTSGNLLDGNSDGTSGGDFSAQFRRSGRA